MMTKEEKKAANRKKALRKKRLQNKIDYRRRLAEKELDLNRDPVKVLERKWPQYMAFSADCLVSVLVVWTRFPTLYSQYKRYCEVTGEKPELSRGGFAKALATQFVKKNGPYGSLYSVALRRDVIIDDPAGLPKIYKDADDMELFKNPPKEDTLEGENWMEDEEYE